MAEAKLVVSGVGEILKLVMSKANEEIGLVWNVKEELNKLIRTVTAIQALLHDAEKQQEEKETVRLFLKRLKDVAYDAEDVLDEFGYQTTRLKLTNSKVSYYFLHSISVPFKSKMAKKIKKINMEFDDIKSYMDSFSFASASILPTNVLQNRETTMPIETFSFVDESEVVGRDVDKSEIVSMLTSPDNQGIILSVLPIVGMGGLGKTTLAKLAYKDGLVVKYFDERIWVHVSIGFDSKKILTNILESVTKRACQFSSIELIHQNLKDELGQKRFLLVLDDVWNVDCELISSLKIGARGSKIIATTRIVEVASMIGTLATYHLKNLSEDNCWSILKNRAFGNGGAEETPNMVAIGKEIVKKCGGVPLAAKSLGGLMRIKKDEQEWLSIKNSEIWDLQPMGKDGILPALKLSYDHLPSPLKQCFLYCSIFPKGAYILKNDLIQQWMVLGFLQPSIGGRPMEDIGNDYINYLLCNSFFQDAEKTTIGEIMKFKMHDLVFDLAHSLSRSDNATVGVAEFKNNSDVVHLRLLYMDGDIKKIQEGLCMARNLRSLHLECIGTRTSICNNVLDILFKKFKHLRVLHLPNCGIKELPSSIKKLKHLRYFNLRGNPIEALPESITSLYNLQTLDLLLCPVKELPLDMRKMVNLRQLMVYQKGGCLISQMPIEMGRLFCLNNLLTFVVGHKRGQRIKELQHLDLGRVLNIYNLENVRSRGEAEDANLMGKEKLVGLHLYWGSGVNWGGDSSSSSSSVLMGNDDKKSTIVEEDDHVLQGLRPHSNLKELSIENFGGENLPGWMMSTGIELFLPNLVKLYLQNCERLECVPSLGWLPSLKVLHIKGVKRMKSLGSESYDGGDGRSINGRATTLFPSLEELSLGRLRSLEEWREPSAAQQEGSLSLDCSNSFPRLKKIFVIDCPKLVTMPSRFASLKLLQIIRSNGILLRLVVEVPSLSKLHIVEVPELKFLPNGLLLHNNIKVLHIQKCPNLEAIITPPSDEDENENVADDDGVQEVVQLPSSLEILQVNNCPSLTSLPDLRGLQHSLRKFCFHSNEKITRLPEGLHTLRTLELLSIGGFSSELESFPDLEPLQHFPSLRTLHIEGWSKLTSLPEQLQSLTQLQRLGIHVFHSLTALREWLGNLSLRTLMLKECNNLMYFPKVEEGMRCFTVLEWFSIVSCPLLKERCIRERGEEWPTIKHIQNIKIDGQYI
ncbi:putative disease resistance protein RGA1 [Telopea speciosissima]|uniref:putative disease resistance protein RGA1 n=1 Tax=Telopea speciosissima TaxID=54955 RepID=UPI001CC47211|nr:putative disease resistance protein RGA1 [Telopea speciosissima]